MEFPFDFPYSPKKGGLQKGRDSSTANEVKPPSGKWSGVTISELAAHVDDTDVLFICFQGAQRSASLAQHYADDLGYSTLNLLGGLQGLGLMRNEDDRRKAIEDIASYSHVVISPIKLQLDSTSQGILESIRQASEAKGNHLYTGMDLQPLIQELKREGRFMPSLSTSKRR